MSIYRQKLETVEAIQLLLPITINLPNGSTKTGQQGDYLILDSITGLQDIVPKDEFESKYDKIL